MTDLFFSGDLSFAFFDLSFVAVSLTGFTDFEPFVAVFIALGAIAEQVGRFANANVLFSISYTTSFFNLYGAKMFRDSAQHINMLFCAKVKRSFFIPISLVRMLCAWSAVVTAPLLLPSMYT